MRGWLLLVGVVGFALGILLCAFISIGWFGLSFIFLLASIFGLFWISKKSFAFAAACMLLFGILLGGVRTELVPRTVPSAFLPLAETYATIEGEVVVDPDVRETTQRLTVEISEGGQSTRILVVAPIYPSIRYGEIVRAPGILVYPEPFATTEGREFAYDAYLAKDGIFLLMQNAAVEQSALRTGLYTQVRGALSDFKFAGLDALSNGLPEPHASLAGGLILGGKQGLGKELLADFITTGLIHIVVLSGYNVMIIAQFMLLLFRNLSRRYAPLIAGITIMTFVLAAGAGPASIRAGIMAGIGLYGRATGRTYDAFRALIFAGVVMLVWNPLTLPFDTGFQLSFVATLGLIFGVPITERWFSWVRSAFMREIVSSTVAAQIAVLPLLLYQNGLFSVVALPANVLVLPLVPLTMLFSAVAAGAGFLLPALAPVFSFPAYLLLSYITGIVENAANLPFAAFSLPAFPFWVVILAYVLLGTYVATPHAVQSASRQRPN